MNEYFKFIFLAIIQGISEFLPISSSGHLVLFENLYNFQANEMITFNLVVHLGTLLAIICFFFQDLQEISKGVIKEWKIFQFNDYNKILLFILLADLPAIIVGLTLRNYIISLHYNILIIAICFLVTAIILQLTFWVKEPKEEKIDNILQAFSKLNIKIILLIGIAQSLALLPGISRSGITIATALFLKVNRNIANKFSFIISIPLILGAFILEFSNSFANISVNYLFIYILSFFIAFLFGFFSLKVLSYIMKTNKFYLFSYYLFLLSISILIYNYIF